MKKISLFAVLTLVPLCGAMAMQNNTQSQNNTNAKPSYWSVTEVMTLPDNTPVKMRGRITKNMGDNIYMFEDSSGTVMLEIEEEDWNGKTVRVNDMVTIYGNVDKGPDYTEVDVYSVER